MERRAFLALLASAPIAALAPWPKILEQRQLTGYFFAFTHQPQTLRFEHVYDANSWLDQWTDAERAEHRILRGV